MDTDKEWRVKWTVIPKGLQEKRLRVSILAGIDPDSNAIGSVNWTEFVKLQLKGFKLVIKQGGVNVLANSDSYELINEGYLNTGIWETVFDQKTARIAASAPSFLQTEKFFPVCTGSFAVHVMRFARRVQGAQLQRTLLNSRSNTVIPDSESQFISIDDLFPGQWKKGSPEQTDLSYLVGFAGDLNKVFNTSAPSLKERTRDKVKKKDYSDYGATTLLNAAENAYARPHVRSIEKNQDNKEQNIHGDRISVLTEFGAELLKARYNMIAEVPSGLKIDVILSPELNASMDQLLTTIPRAISPNVQDALRAREGSAINRLAMLKAEPGLLAPAGLVFDMLLPLPVQLRDGDEIAVEAIWTNINVSTLLITSTGVFTAVTSHGLPASEPLEHPENSVFDPCGLMRLGAKDGEFVATDFNADLASLSITTTVLDARNRSIEANPAWNADSGEHFVAPPITSDDVAIHLMERVKTFKKRRDDFQNSNKRCLYLEDLIIGTRLDVGAVEEIDGQKKVTWFAAGKRLVTYEAFKELERKPQDLERDEAFDSLWVSEYRTYNYEKTNDRYIVESTVRGEMTRWNPLGSAMESIHPKGTKTTLGKTVSAEPRSYLHPRFGLQLAFGIRYVFSDGSCLINLAEAAERYYGKNFRENNKFLLHKHAFTSGEFILRRWEKLCAPICAFVDEPIRGQWWPRETTRRLVIATSSSNNLKEQHRSERWILPKSLSVLECWKHGVFRDDVKPWESAFEGYSLEPIDSRPLNPTVNPEISTDPDVIWRHRLGRQKSPNPYHPDPLVTTIRFFVGRKSGQALGTWCAISDSENNLPTVFDCHLYDNNKWPYARGIKLSLHASKASQSSACCAVNAAKGKIKVSLPPGERLTILAIPLNDDTLYLTKVHGLSALLDAEIKEKNISNRQLQWSEFPQILMTIAEVTEIELEHIVDVPTMGPNIHQLVVNRIDGAKPEKDETKIHGNVRAEVAPGSTGALEIIAAWQHYIDSLDQLPMSQRSPSKDFMTINGTRRATVGQWRASEQNSSKHKSSQNVVRRPPLDIDVVLKHDFKDTRHRVIQWNTRAIGMAPSRFDADQHKRFDDYRFFTSSSNVTERIEILSTRSPLPPTILEPVLPAFAFSHKLASNSLTRRRTAAFLLELERDWWSSGEDEQLGVVLLPGGLARGDFDEVSRKYRNIASFWGADPAREHASTLSHLPTFFGKNHLAGEGMGKRVPVKITPDQETPATPGAPPPIPLDVDIVPFVPTCAGIGQPWKVLVHVINPSNVARAMIRLAVVRYQPHSIAGCEVSKPVMLDHHGLLDDREAIVKRDAQDDRKLTVTLHGIAAIPVISEKLPESDKPSTYPNITSQVTISLERGTASIDNLEIWEAEETILAQPQVREGRTYWTAVFRSEHSLRWTKYRIAILEEEISPADKKGGINPIPKYFDFLYLDEIG
ncbi:hypothetical protein [Nitrosospira sp. Nsp18]|uniref:hypothetical protein n=1 Tax=Nitrosospira sp. Nsp18 TaxID=1855334 RepID=UPI00115FABEE|nr:hypothetical protein [Nitrosospira sp. Nsp18]